MNIAILSSDYKKAIADYLQINEEQVFLSWKGRVSFYCLLKAMGVKEGDEIILPAFTCVVVPNAIIYLGAKPVYVDIDPSTYNIDPSRIEEKITSKTKIIIAQNTFGLSPDLDSISAIAQKHNLRVIEDCTHGFGGHYKERKNGTIAEASFFSTQWNKPFSTGIGGFAVLKDLSLFREMTKMDDQLEKPSAKDEIVLKLLIKLRRYLVNSAFYYSIVNLYRRLSKARLVIGSSSGGELENTTMPEGYLKGMSSVQAKEGMRELKEVNTYIDKRKNIAESYNRLMRELNLPTPFVATKSEHTFLKYPLLVKNREEFFKLARKAKIETGDWFLSPIHPVTSDLSKWDFVKGQYPVAEKISRHIVNLPTNPFMSEKKVNEVLSFISSHKKLIVSDIQTR